MDDILVIEDDPELGPAIAEALGGAILATTHAEGLRLAAGQPWAAIVLDRQLPDGNGIELLTRLRGMEIATPVLILTALHETPRRLEGFAAGADDYLGKPFAMEELTARLAALRRRAGAQPHPNVTVLGDLEIWHKARTAVRAGQPLGLSDLEFRLLCLLAEHHGVLVTRSMILERIFNYRPGLDPGTNVVEVAMSRLRQKLDKPFAAEMIETHRQRGYVLRLPGG